MPFSSKREGVPIERQLWLCLYKWCLLDIGLELGKDWGRRLEGWGGE